MQIVLIIGTLMYRTHCDQRPTCNERRRMHSSRDYANHPPLQTSTVQQTVETPHSKDWKI